MQACRPPSLIWMLVLIGVAMALPLPPAHRSHADPDGAALQPAPAPALGEADGGEALAPAGAPAPQQVEALEISAEVEARLLARLRHEVRADVEDLAMQSMERAVRQLRARDGTPPRPLGGVVRLTFALEPPVPGVAPVSVVTRTTGYAAYCDTLRGAATFTFNVVGDIQFAGVQRDRVAVDFSALAQFGEGARDGESGSCGANGSAELTLGEPERLMSVGSRDLVLTVSALE